MEIIVCNIGSSSFKFQLLDMEEERELARGHFERVGMPQSAARFWKYGKPHDWDAPTVSSQKEAVRIALEFLEERVLDGLHEVDAVGFKCVQGGDKNGTLLLETDVLEAMERFKSLAPAHNPPYLEAIYMFQDLLPETPLVGVFEPGFHVNAPQYTRIYGTPYDWISFGVRRYGYHGASHRYVSGETVRLLNLDPRRHRVITCHLGGSSSLCAVKNGVSIDTSMGFTPQTGLLQGKRVGDLDPFVLPFIMEQKGITLEEALRECSENAGLAGLSGTSGDMRDVKEAAEGGDPRARLAREKYIYDVRRYMGEYLVLLEGLDAIAFTGGIGQHDAELREKVFGSLSFLGARLDPERNRRHDCVISRPDSSISAVVLETNEGLVVARETARLVSQSSPSSK